MVSQVIIWDIDTIHTVQGIVFIGVVPSFTQDSVCGQTSGFITDQQGYANTFGQDTPYGTGGRNFNVVKGTIYDYGFVTFS